ncbi:MAG: flagellar biosynthesis protein FlhB [Planctomycetota bacterium]
MASGESGEKTEEPTAKRLNEARSEGQVAMSTEFIAALMLVASIGSFLVLGRGLVGAGGQLLVSSFERVSLMALHDLSPADFASLMSASVDGMARALAIMLTPVLIVGLIAGYGQIGFKIAPKALKVDLKKLSPASGAKKIFGMRGAVRTGLGLVKVVLIGLTVFGVALWQLPAVSAVAGTDAGQVVRAVGHVFLLAASAGAVVIVALSLIDFMYQRYQFNKDMKMTKQEVKEEAKNAEGDPQVKARIRAAQREIASRRMMEDVPEATVVITNPTHYAVALRYDNGRDAAPTVVAKGLDFVALRIRAVASEAGVMIVEEPPLARALHRSCEIGDAVPENLFEAVAKVLAYVYRMEGRSVTA